jgi:hypothetical protein
MRRWFKISFLMLKKLNIYKINCQISATAAAAVEKRGMSSKKSMHETSVH